MAKKLTLLLLVSVFLLSFCNRPCNGGGGEGGKSFGQFERSPRVSSSTRAILTNNDFRKGGSGGGPSECDGKFHGNSAPIVALSSGWYDGGSRCGKKIRIKARNGRSVMAKVVDECAEPACRNNIVDGSNGVWHALGLDINVGEEHVTWSDHA